MCCWRFVRLEAGGRVRSRGRPHAAVVPRRYMRAGYPSVLLAPSRNPRYPRRLVPQVRLLAPLGRSPPDFFFHVRPTQLHLTSSFSARAPSDLSLSLVPARSFLPISFTERQTAGLFIARVPGYRNRRVILHSGPDMPARGERCEEDEWTRGEND